MEEYVAFLEAIRENRASLPAWRGLEAALVGIEGSESGGLARLLEIARREGAPKSFIDSVAEGRASGADGRPRNVAPASGAEVGPKNVVLESAPPPAGAGDHFFTFWELREGPGSFDLDPVFRFAAHRRSGEALLTRLPLPEAVAVAAVVAIPAPRPAVRGHRPHPQ